MLQPLEELLESAKLLCTRLGENPSELTCPRGAVACFCYRHAVELFLRSCILFREPIERCNHDISHLQRQYRMLFPGSEYVVRTVYDISLRDIKDLVGDRIEVEDFEFKEDQVYHYFSDKEGRSPKATYGFGPGMWLSMLDQLECDINRIWDRIRVPEGAAE